MSEIVIIEESTTAMLSQTVNAKLRDGYALHGSPFAFKDKVCQAMIK